MILIALGANLPSRFGGPEETLEAAKIALEAAQVRMLSASRVWITEPVPKSDQPYFRNAVIQVDTALCARSLLRVLHHIEADFGRVRSERNAPRCIDLDLIAYNDVQIDEGEAEIIVPHPRMHERAFVLAPLCDIAPGWVHPVMNRTAQDLLDALQEDGVFYPVREDAA